MEINTGFSHLKKHGPSIGFMLCVDRLVASAMFGLKFRFRGHEIHDAFDKTDDSGNGRPREKQIENAHSGFAEIEFVDSEIPQENPEQSGHGFVLHSNHPFRI